MKLSNVSLVENFSCLHNYEVSLKQLLDTGNRQSKTVIINHLESCHLSVSFVFETHLKKEGDSLNELKFTSIKLLPRITHLVFKTKKEIIFSHEKEMLKIVDKAQKFNEIQTLEVNNFTFVLQLVYFQHMINEITSRCKTKGKFFSQNFGSHIYKHLYTKNFL